MAVYHGYWKFSVICELILKFKAVLEGRGFKPNFLIIYSERDARTPKKGFLLSAEMLPNSLR